MTFDVVISGGRVLDGTGAPPFRADVAISGDRIATVGRIDPAGAGAVIDATGRFVAPGFVDCHAHGDAAVFDPAVQRAALRQGVTTFVLGQDGLSFAPGSAATVAYASRYFAAVNGALTDGPLSVRELLDGYDGAVALNTAYLLPHGTIRYDVMGPSPDRAAPADLDAMVRRVEQGLSEGAVGLSSGLEYLPGRYADAAELAALCAPLGGLPYVTHMRAYGQRAETGMTEVMEIAELSGGPRSTSPTCTVPPTCCCRWSSRRSARASTSPSTPTPTCAATRSWRWSCCRRRCRARSRKRRWR
ncbi:amidohydrolase family protein [Nonomuraea salmonea]|uniref:amidohydrolase family protein n=1 Tax=Nonomuraea salmonea TaxID=46181 RepID=UPI002FE78629